MRKKNTPKGPSYFSYMSEFVQNRWDYVMELMNDYGSIVRMPGITRNYLVNDADMLKYILKENADNYLKEGFYLNPIKRALGTGLLMMKGVEWKHRRKLFAPVFYRKNIEQFVPIMQSIIKAKIDSWEKYASSQESFHIDEESMAIVYLIAVKVFFGKDLDEATTKKVLWAVVTENNFATSLSALMPWLPTPNCLRMNRAKKYLRSHIEWLIDEGRKHPEDNLLNKILSAKTNDNNPFTDEDIYNEARVFLLTGHETSGTAITWTFYLLALYPEYQQKVKEELEKVLSDRAPEMKDLDNLPFTQAVFSESLRLFPPIWTMLRQCKEDDYIGDYFIKKGSNMVISLYTLHRREEYWPEPFEFIPERHLPDYPHKAPAFAFLPFSGGPRICIASHFATLECIMTIAMVLQRYTLRLDETHNVEMHRAISLKPRYGIKVFLEKD